ncbi:hypothetical protein GCM10010236_44680 [Streptomyces eurythermus]|nr:hypothetical protein GCM10010236_44680 [Streptomyces eurythermus]
MEGLRSGALEEATSYSAGPAPFRSGVRAWLAGSGRAVAGRTGGPVGRTGRARSPRAAHGRSHHPDNCLLG